MLLKIWKQITSGMYASFHNLLTLQITTNLNIW